MHLKNQPPIFVPEQFRAEIEKLSKAALMDLAWDFATRCAGASSDDTNAVMAELRTAAGIVVEHRKQAAL